MHQASCNISADYDGLFDIAIDNLELDKRGGEAFILLDDRKYSFWCCRRYSPPSHAQGYIRIR